MRAREESSRLLRRIFVVLNIFGNIAFQAQVLHEWIHEKECPVGEPTFYSRFCETARIKSVPVEFWSPTVLPSCNRLLTNNEKSFLGGMGMARFVPFGGDGWRFCA